MHRRAALAVLFVPVVFLAKNAHATPTRVVSLGDMGLFLNDEANLFQYPGQVAKYGNLFELDLAGAAGKQLSELNNSAGGGAFLRATPKLTIGAWASDYTNPLISNFLTSVDDFSAASNAGQWKDLASKAKAAGGGSERKYDLFAGYALSEAMLGGVQLSYGSQGIRAVPGPNSKSPGQDYQDNVYNQSDFRLAAGLSSGAADEGWDATLAYQYSGISYSVDNYPHFTGGIGTTLALTGRYRTRLSQYWTIIPVVDYRVDLVNLTEDTQLVAFCTTPDCTTGHGKELPGREERKHSYTGHNLNLGLGGKFHATERVNFWGAVGFQLNYIGAGASVLSDDKALNNVNFGESTTIWDLPYLRAGLEAQLNDWLVFRGGVRKEVLLKTENKSKEAPDANASFNRTTRTDLGVDEGNASFAGFVGFGVRYSGLVGDLLIDPSFFFRGPQFISGSGGNLAIRATLAYAF